LQKQQQQQMTTTTTTTTTTKMQTNEKFKIDGMPFILIIIIIIAGLYLLCLFPSL